MTTAANSKSTTESITQAAQQVVDGTIKVVKETAEIVEDKVIGKETADKEVTPADEKTAEDEEAIEKLETNDAKKEDSVEEKEIAEDTKVESDQENKDLEGASKRKIDEIIHTDAKKQKTEE